MHRLGHAAADLALGRAAQVQRGQRRRQLAQGYQQRQRVGRPAGRQRLTQLGRGQPGGQLAHEGALAAAGVAQQDQARVLDGRLQRGQRAVLLLRPAGQLPFDVTPAALLLANRHAGAGVQLHVDAVQRHLLAAGLLAAHSRQGQHVAALAQTAQIGVARLLASRRFRVGQVLQVFDVDISFDGAGVGADGHSAAGHFFGRKALLPAGDAAMLGGRAAASGCRLVGGSGTGLLSGAAAAHEAPHSHQPRADPQQQLHQVRQPLNGVAVVADENYQSFAHCACSVCSEDFGSRRGGVALGTGSASATSEVCGRTCTGIGCRNTALRSPTVLP